MHINVPLSQVPLHQELILLHVSPADYQIILTGDEPADLAHLSNPNFADPRLRLPPEVKQGCSEGGHNHAALTQLSHFDVLLCL